MHSVPERKKKDERRTRLEQYGAGGIYTRLPDLDGFDWLAGAFQESGMYQQGGMGISPLSWQEINGYNHATGNTLTHWALTMLRQMSEAYVSWYYKGGKQGDMAEDVPYIDKSEEAMQAHREYLMQTRDRSAKNREELSK